MNKHKDRMKRQLSQIFIVLLGSVFLLSDLAVSGAPTPAEELLPEELEQIAQGNGYKEVKDFYYQLPGYVGRPYMYGYDLEGDEGNSAVFWAMKTNDSSQRAGSYYLLVAKRDSISQSLMLVKAIQWSALGVLYHSRSKSVNLAKFKYVDSLNASGPDTTINRLNAFVRENESSTDLFVEYKGNWLVLMQSDW